MEKKAAKMKYPKLEKHRKENYKDFTLNEPVRRMLFDKVLDNLKMLERVTYIHRIIYIGEHSSVPELPSMIATTMNLVDDQPDNAEKLTGFLLVYQKFFVHMVEGSEDMINEHIGTMLRKYASTKEIRNMKLLIQVSHVLKRLCPEWMCYFGVPPKLLTALEEDASMEETGRRLYTCLRQTYNLITTFVKDNSQGGEAESKDSRESDKESRLSEKESFSHGFFFGENVRSPSISSSLRESRSNSLNRSNVSSLGFLKDRYWQHLPEIEILDALIRSEYTLSVRAFYDKYMLVPQRDIYKDKVWPVPGDFIPFDVFANPYECVIELRQRKDTKKLEQDGAVQETDEAVDCEVDEPTQKANE
nr:unnamed protein product [Callosobruchus chinensis]